MLSTGNSCFWLYRIFLIPVVLVQTRKNFTFVPTGNTLHLLGFLNGSIYLRDSVKVYDVDTLELSKKRSGRLCSSPCGPNSIVLLNSAKNVILVCGGVDNGLCSVRNLSDFTSLINANSDGALSSISVAVSSRTSRPAIGIVTDSGGMYVAVTYGPGIKPDRFAGNSSFHETYKFVISRMKWNGKILNRDKSLPFRLPRNVHLDDYLIFFKDGIVNKKQLFFLTNQKFKVGEDQPYTSKLLSICRNDPYFYSYTDIVLECRYKDRRYNLIQDTHVVKADGVIRKTFNLFPSEDEDVLVGVFAPGDDPDRPETSSAVCLYSFKDIRSKLKEARQKFIICPGSNLTENERYLDNNVQGGCLMKERFSNAATADLGEDCQKPWPLYSYVIGDVVLSAHSVFELNSTHGRLTKVFVQTFKDDHFGDESVVLYGGTSTGKILTLSLQVSSESFHVFDEIDMDLGQPVKALHVDEEHYIYAMNNRKLIKYGSFDCDRYSSCESVTHSFNPFCGWCVYQSRSFHLRDPACQNMHGPNHLLPYSRSCSSLVLRLQRFEVNKVTQIFFHVERLPEPLIGDQYYCEFKYDHGATVYHTGATRGENASFTCDTPTASHHSKAVLKLLVSTTSVTSQSRHNITLAHHPILFYDCRYFTSCKGCTDNIPHRCVWLLQDGRCTSKDASSAASVNVSEALLCPKVLHSSRTIPVTHSNVPVNVFVDVANVHEFMKLACCTRGNRCSDALFVNASMIQCTVQIDTNTSKLTVPIQVNYANHYLLGSVSYEVTVYNCKHLVKDCNQCKALNTTKYQCLWCHDGHSSYCGFIKAKECIPEDTCPPPVITKVSPSSAPVRGGTIVTISGHELGSSSDSITAVKLAGVDCHLIPDGYVLSKQAVCEAGDASTVSEEANFRGQVEITVYNMTASGLSFVYKNPAPRTVQPVSGPQAGGTAMTISGSNLDIGNRKVVACFVTDDSRRLCGNATVVEASGHTSEHHLKLVMPSAGYASEVTDVEVTFDGQTLRKIETKYRFLKDPVIETIVPKKSISSGGIKVTLFGSHLTNAHDAKIFISHGSYSKIRKCKFKSDKEVICRTPSLSDADLGFERGTAVDSSIHLDGVIKKFNLDYFADPQIGPTFIVNSSTFLDVMYGHLLIEGRHLNLAATESDIRVMVGHAQCPIVSFNETTIECMVPKTHHKDVGEALQVNVTIGDLHKLVGYIREPEVSDENSGAFLTIIILASLIGVLGIVVLIVAIRSLKICTRKNKERLRYLTMSRMDSHDTPILSEGERRHSNGNIYEVINDLHLVDGRTHSERTDVTDDLKHVEDDDPSYDSLDNSPKTERGEAFQLAANAAGYQTDLPTDLNCDDCEDESACKQTYKDYYLSPVLLKREISTEN